MLADCALAILVEGRWKPKRSAVRQRAEAGIKMIKPRIHKFHGNSETTKDVCHGAMRLNVRTKFVATKEHVAAKERVAFALEIKIFRQPPYFIAALFHPFRKERLLAGALFVAEIAGDEFATNRQPGVGRENHVRKSRLRRN